MRTKFLPTAAVSLAGLLMIHAPARAAGETLFDFDADEMKSSEWRIVNDGVMGGLSKGQMDVSKDGVLTFSGKLSLENNGVSGQVLHFNIFSVRGWGHGWGQLHFNIWIRRSW
jgi:hypothetical protein